MPEKFRFDPPRFWASGRAREHLGSSGKLWGSPGTPQEQLRNERREFQENRVFQAWEASGGPRGTQNRWGGLAGAKEKSQILRSALGPPPRFEGFLLLASEGEANRLLLLTFFFAQGSLGRLSASSQSFMLVQFAPSKHAFGPMNFVYFASLLGSGP